MTTLTPCANINCGRTDIDAPTVCCCATRNPEADLAVTTIIDLSTDHVQQWDRVDGVLVVEVVDCFYCGGADVPLVDTTEGRHPVPHQSKTHRNVCQWGTIYDPATRAITVAP